MCRPPPSPSGPKKRCTDWKARQWTPEEDAILWQAIARHGHLWEPVSAELRRRGYDRNAVAARNRELRIRRGLEQVQNPEYRRANGGAAYVCQFCGLPRRGHSCPGSEAAAKGRLRLAAAAGDTAAEKDDDDADDAADDDDDDDDDDDGSGRDAAEVLRSLQTTSAGAGPSWDNGPLPANGSSSASSTSPGSIVSGGTVLHTPDECSDFDSDGDDDLPAALALMDAFLAPPDQE